MTESPIRKKTYTCGFCNQILRSNNSLNKHIKSYHADRVKCDYCPSYLPKSKIKKHIQIIHDICNNKCSECNQSVYFIYKYASRDICRKCYKNIHSYSSHGEMCIIDDLNKLSIARSARRSYIDELLYTVYSFRSLEIWIECSNVQVSHIDFDYYKNILEKYRDKSKKLVVIKLNTGRQDNYTHTPVADRYKRLEQLFIDTVDKPPDEDIHFYYMFYNKSTKNKNYINTYKHSFID